MGLGLITQLHGPRILDCIEKLACMSKPITYTRRPRTSAIPASHTHTTNHSMLEQVVSPVTRQLLVLLRFLCENAICRVLSNSLLYRVLMACNSSTVLHLEPRMYTYVWQLSLAWPLTHWLSMCYYQVGEYELCMSRISWGISLARVSESHNSGEATKQGQCFMHSKKRAHCCVSEATTLTDTGGKRGGRPGSLTKACRWICGLTRTTTPKRYLLNCRGYLMGRSLCQIWQTLSWALLGLVSWRWMQTCLSHKRHN